MAKKAIIFFISLLCGVIAIAQQAPAPYGVLPTKAQLNWQETEVYGIVHFGMATYTDKEWAYGSENNKLFNPKHFSATQIVQAAKQGGLKGLVIVAKHHDGFCLWPTKTTEHNINNSPYKNGKGDLLKEYRQACSKAGVKMGVYCSPWDRNNAQYGQPEYVTQVYRNQLQELYANYGALFMSWHDGANGGDGYYGGKNETRKIDKGFYYGWEQTWPITRSMQPGACIFGDAGPDVRWVGNEEGKAGNTCWATYTPQAAEGSTPSNGNTRYEEGIEGTRNGQYWMPAECDVPLRPGWFYHTSEDGRTKTSAQLTDLYYSSVGRGACLNLGIAPNKEGVLAAEDVKALTEFGAIISKTFSKNLLSGAMLNATNTRSSKVGEYALQHLTDGDRYSYWATDDAVHNAEITATMQLPATFNIIRLRENIKLGQRIDSAIVEVWQHNQWQQCAAVTSIGACRLIRLPAAVTTNKIRVRLFAPVCITLSDLGLFLEPHLQAATTASYRHNFTLGNNEFLLDGHPIQLISGEMHPARIPRQYWQHRIQMAKAMGCNTIALYVFWNYHEALPGQFDFTTDNRDIAAFIQLCKQEGIWVLLRPGPYVCGEWDFGGLPPYLLKDPAARIRCSDATYMGHVARYVKRLTQEIKPLLCTNGGPIIMVQIENEYGSFGNDKQYLEQLKQLWLNNGINVPFYTSDGPTRFMLEAGTVKGAAIGLDSGFGDADFDLAHGFAPSVPAFSGETYPGWLTHWHEKWAAPSTDDIVKQVKYLMDNHKSFNLYVLHGGTNFGFTAGANAFSPTQFQPDVTSYDYDAPINEQGQPTPKYHALRQLIGSYASHPLPAIPAPLKAQTIAPFTMVPVTDVWHSLPKATHSPTPLPMEYIGQYSGFILYSTKLIGHKSGDLTITEPHDYALVLLNGKLVDTVYRDGGKWTVKLPATNNPNPTLYILVENMGHINFAQYMTDRKGITDRVTLNGMTLFDWDIYNLPMNTDPGKMMQPACDSLHDGVFFKGTFEVSDTLDTYLDVSQLSKGAIWVNGHNLGRYWHVGPQTRLYCPGTWLRKGTNNVTVWDMHLNTATTIEGKLHLKD